MKATRIIFTFCFLLSLTATMAQSSAKVWATIDNKEILPKGDQMISSDPNFQALINTYHITSIEQALPSSRRDHLLKVYEITCDCDQIALMNEINTKENGVKGAEPGPEYQTLYTPNDYNLAFSTDYALSLIGAEYAWDFTRGDSTVEIAISDTNYDLNHEEITGTTTIINSPFYYSDTYHGTAVATLAAGNTDNAQGKSSIGSDCSLQLYNLGLNNILTATYNNARVINVSWASGCYYSQYAQDAIDEAYDNGSIIVAAAGNGPTCGGSSNYVYPASYDHVISVTSVGAQNNHEKTIGDPSTAHQHNDKVDIAAPGYDVPLTVSSGWYLTGNGTSFAAPIVSGTIGLMLSVNPCLEFEDVEMILQQTAFDLSTDNPNYIGQLGAGRLDAGAAVEMAANMSFHNVQFASSFDCAENAWNITPSFQFSNPISGAEWMDESTDITYAATTTGWNTVKLFDQDGCFGVDSFYVEVPTTPFQVLGTHQDVSCNGMQDGEIELLVSGGEAPYTYNWSNGNNGPNANGLDAGFYSVSITDALGCEFTQNYNITEPTPLVIDYTVDCEYDNNENGMIDLNVTGGTAPYEFDWNINENSEDLNNLEAGSYSVYVEDANGCGQYEDIIVCASSTASVEENSSAYQLYPNPSNNGTVYLNWTGDLDEVKIYNTSGQLIQTISVSQSNKQLAIEQLSGGLYFVKYMHQNQTVGSEKLVVTG